jgi:hypothetical protein
MSSFQLMCKVIVLQLISNVVPKVSPKHNIVILWYILYKLCELLRNFWKTVEYRLRK